MTDENDRDDKVGYGRPPVKNRFKAGQSGNPKGRPKGSKNWAWLIGQELDQRVTITEGGKRRQITKLGVIAKQVVNSAAKGDPRILQLLLKILPGQDEPATGQGPLLSEDDYKTLQSHLKRLKRGQDGEDDGHG